MSRRDKLEGLLEQHPDDVFLNFGLAMELVKEGLAEEALARFDHVLELDPGYVVAHYQKGTTLVSLRRLDDACSALEAGIEAAQAAGDSHARDKMTDLMDTIRR